MDRNQKDNITNTSKWNLWTYILPLLNKIAQIKEIFATYCLPTDQQFADKHLKQKSMEEVKGEISITTYSNRNISRLDLEESICSIDDSINNRSDLNFNIDMITPVSKRTTITQGYTTEKTANVDDLASTTATTQTPMLQEVNKDINIIITPHNVKNDSFVSISNNACSFRFDDDDIINVELSPKEISPISSLQ